MMKQRTREFYAGKFGLPPEQIKTWSELVEMNMQRFVMIHFGKVNPEKYIYAVKRDGSGIVTQRHNRNAMADLMDGMK